LYGLVSYIIRTRNNNKRKRQTYSLGVATLGGLDLDTDTTISKLLGSNDLGAQLELEALLGESAMESLTTNRKGDNSMV
jgi:hypothetical protein